MTRSLGAIGHVGCWMDHHDIDAELLNANVLNAFLADHVDRHGQLPWTGVMPMLDYLPSAGVAAPETARENQLEASKCPRLDDLARSARA